MLTTFDQVKEWITDNGFKRWVLYKDYTRKEKIIDSSSFAVSDQADKIAMTEKYLRWAGGHAYAAGANRMGEDDLTTVTEISLAGVQPLNSAQGAAGVGGYPSIGELRSELTDTITKQIRAEMQVKDMERREKDLEQREKDFAEKQNGLMGVMIGYLAPYIPALKKGLEYRAVAGTEGRQNIIAGDGDIPFEQQPIVPKNDPDPEPGDAEGNPFTDEEEERYYNLGVRFKKAEANWLDLLESVVKMAEDNDPMYGTAKGFLLKK